MVVSPFKHWMWKKGVILLLATDQSCVKAGMICFITIHGVQVLAFETIASGSWLQATGPLTIPLRDPQQKSS